MSSFLNHPSELPSSFISREARTSVTQRANVVIL